MMRRAFTLVEMLMVVSIISILAAMSIAALVSASEQGKRQRAEVQVARIDQLIAEKWNGYRFRQLPVRIPANIPPAHAARFRLDVLRELMRLELPDRLSDITDDPVCPARTSQLLGYAPGQFGTQPMPSLLNAYRRRIPATATTQWEQAECLYLILAEMRDGEDTALQNFLTSEIGDVDGDGLNEILDPWGTPIMWLRWAPGHSKYESTDAELSGTNIPAIPVAADTSQVPNGLIAPDPFDPLKIDPRWMDNTPGAWRPFNLRPLIWSAGGDEEHDILIGQTDAAGNPTLRYAQSTPPNDPYVGIVGGWMGTPTDVDQDGRLLHGDNISNHAFGLRD
jgi:prepilin-type N-terminal cleavage/methylation domain-containing protein